MFKLIQRLTSNKKTNTEVYCLPLGCKVVYLAELEAAVTLHSI